MLCSEHITNGEYRKVTVTFVTGPRHGYLSSNGP